MKIKTLWICLIVVLNSFINFRLVNAAPGDLDASFGNDGFVVTDVNNGSSEQVLRAVLQDDDKIVVVGISGSLSSLDSMVARYNSDGSLDSDFSGDGLATFNLAASMNAEGFLDAAVLEDGSMLLHGLRDADNDPNMEAFEVITLKVDSQGDVITSFGTSGLATLPVAGNFIFPTRIHVLPDGKFLSVAFSIDSMVQNVTIVTSRFDSDGNLDTSFGTNGSTSTSVGLFFAFFAAVNSHLLPDGKILVPSGLVDPMALTSQAGVVRLLDDGSLDTDFGDNGFALLDAGAGILTAFGDVGVQSDGKIVASGVYGLNADEDFLVARFEADGTIDTSFGPGGQGFAHTNIEGNSMDRARALLVQDNDKIVLAGSSELNGLEDMAVIRYNPDGSLDNEATFSEDGIQLIDFPANMNDEASFLLEQPDGKLLVGGNSNNGTDDDIALTRLLTDPGDLAIDISADQTEINFGEEINLTISVDNLADTTASNVVVSSNDPAELDLVSATPTQGSCNDTLPLSCDIGSLEGVSAAEISVTAISIDVSNSVSFDVSVSGGIDDTDASNNTASTSFKIGAGGGCSLLRF